MPFTGHRQLRGRPAGGHRGPYLQDVLLAAGGGGDLVLAGVTEVPLAALPAHLGAGVPADHGPEDGALSWGGRGRGEVGELGWGPHRTVLSRFPQAPAVPTAHSGGVPAAVPRRKDSRGATRQRAAVSGHPEAVPARVCIAGVGSSGRGAAGCPRRREGRVLASRGAKACQGCPTPGKGVRFLWVPCHSPGESDGLGRNGSLVPTGTGPVTRRAPASEGPQAPGSAWKPGGWSPQGLPHPPAGCLNRQRCKHPGSSLVVTA